MKEVWSACYSVTSSKDEGSRRLIWRTRSTAFVCHSRGPDYSSCADRKVLLWLMVRRTFADPWFSWLTSSGASAAHTGNMLQSQSTLSWSCKEVSGMGLVLIKDTCAMSIVRYSNTFLYGIIPISTWLMPISYVNHLPTPQLKCIEISFGPFRQPFVIVSPLCIAKSDLCNQFHHLDPTQLHSSLATKGIKYCYIFHSLFKYAKDMISNPFKSGRNRWVQYLQKRKLLAYSVQVVEQHVHALLVDLGTLE